MSGTRSRRQGRLVGAAAVAVCVVGLVRLAAGSTDEQALRAASATNAPIEPAATATTTSGAPQTTTPSASDDARTAGAVSLDVPPTAVAGSVTTGEAPRLTHAGVTYAIGLPGDEVSVADWDCDGTSTPGLVRPGTGEVFIFDRWAVDGQPVTMRSAVVVPGVRDLVPPPTDGPCASTLEMVEGAPLHLISTSDGWIAEAVHP